MSLGGNGHDTAVVRPLKLVEISMRTAYTKRAAPVPERFLRSCRHPQIMMDQRKWLASVSSQECTRSCYSAPWPMTMDCIANVASILSGPGVVWQHPQFLICPCIVKRRSKLSSERIHRNNSTRHPYNEHASYREL